MDQRVIWGKVQYRIWNPHQISKSRKTSYSNRSINKEIGLLCPDSHLGKVQYRILNPHQISRSKKKKLFKSVQKKRNYAWTKMPKSYCLNGLLWSRESFDESKISNLESPSNFQVKKEKKYWNRSRNNEIILEIKMPKSSCLKWT